MPMLFYRPAANPAQQQFFDCIGVAVDEQGLKDHLAAMQAALDAGADVNAKHPGSASVTRPVKTGHTALDHYMERKALHEGLAQDERDTEMVSGESVFARKAGLCQKIIDFLRARGASTSQELGRMPPGRNGEGAGRG